MIEAWPQHLPPEFAPAERTQLAEVAERMLGNVTDIPEYLSKVLVPQRKVTRLICGRAVDCYEPIAKPGLREVRIVYKHFFNSVPAIRNFRTWLDDNSALSHVSKHRITRLMITVCILTYDPRDGRVYPGRILDTSRFPYGERHRHMLRWSIRWWAIFIGDPMLHSLTFQDGTEKTFSMSKLRVIQRAMVGAGVSPLVTADYIVQKLHDDLGHLDFSQVPKDADPAFDIADPKLGKKKKRRTGASPLGTQGFPDSDTPPPEFVEDSPE